MHSLREIGQEAPVVSCPCHTRPTRGIAEASNCSFSRSWIRGAPALFIVTSRLVEEGEEFLLDYGHLYLLFYFLVKLDGLLRYWERCTKKEGSSREQAPNRVEDSEALREVEKELLAMMMQAEEP
eukprot:753453-Hanusia_phi.AAC.3